MHAVRQYEFGPPSTLRYEQLPDPEPGEGQVRIAAEAAGVHLIDTRIRQGVESGPFPLPELPIVPGREVAGVVDAVGPGVDAAWAGRRVAAHLGEVSGGYAEYAVAPVEALHRLPDGVAANDAVAMIGTGRTALGILDVAQVRASDIVVVTAAAGGLGSLFVQAVTRVGATAVGLAGGTKKVERARALGAQIAVDYLQPDWPDQAREALGGRQVTVVLDGVAGAVGRAAAGLLGSGGRLVLFGWASGESSGVSEAELQARGVTVGWGIGPSVAQRPGGLRALQERALAEAAAGHWTPPIESFPLAEAARAHAALESRQTIGKVVLAPGR